MDHKIQGKPSSPRGRRCSKTISRQPGPPDTRPSVKGNLVVTPNFQGIVPPQRKYAVQSFLSFCTPCRAVSRAGVGSTHDFFLLRFDAPVLALCVVDLPLHFMCLVPKKKTYRRSPAESVLQSAHRKVEENDTQLKSFLHPFFKSFNTLVSGSFKVSNSNFPQVATLAPVKTTTAKLAVYSSCDDRTSHILEWESTNAPNVLQVPMWTAIP